MSKRAHNDHGHGWIYWYIWCVAMYAIVTNFQTMKVIDRLNTLEASTHALQEKSCK